MGISKFCPTVGDRMFKRSDHVIYPGHGVAVVEDIIDKVVASTTISFLKLTFLFKDMTILVPVYNVTAIGLRYPSTQQEVEMVLNELAKQPQKKLESVDLTPSGWNRRHKDYQTKLQNGGLLELSRIYRDLMHIAQQKDLSFGERTILQTIEDLLSQEIQIVAAQDREVVLQWLRMPFKQFVFHDRSFLHQEVSHTV